MAIKYNGENVLTYVLSLLKGQFDALDAKKVDKVEGKGLSTNDFTTAEKEKLAGIEDNADVNIIESVKVNGEALTVAEDKSVDIAIPTGALAALDEVTEDNLSAELAEKVNASAEGNHAHANKEELDKIAAGDKAKWDAAVAAVEVLNGDEATDGSVAKTVKDYVDTRISSAYKAAGSATLATLPAASADNLGYVYNITEGFTTTDQFVEGAGSLYSAGTNVVVVEDGEVYKYDVLAGFVDLSDYAKTADFVELNNEEVDAIWKDVFTTTPAA